MMVVRYMHVYDDCVTPENSSPAKKKVRIELNLITKLVKFVPNRVDDTNDDCAYLFKRQGRLAIFADLLF